MGVGGRGFLGGQ
uniref:Uncharacterized protein n=1 Tax=Arundo donax TaxID=35708 RepID=A0A0A9FIJ9_ARUDO